MSFDILSIVTKVSQLLLIFVVGVFASKKGIIADGASKSLSKLLSNITSPLMIVCSFCIDFDENTLLRGIEIIVCAVIIHLASSLIAYIIFMPKKGSCKNAPYELATIFSNCGFMGFPILAAIYGDLGIVYGAFYNTVFNIWIWTYGIYALQRHKSERCFDVKKLLFNPGVVATITGFTIFVLKIKIPTVLFGAMDMIGDTTFPLSMIIIGCIAARTSLAGTFRDLKLYVSCAFKLLVIPLITAVACVIFNVERSVVAPVIIILSAMPVATLTAVFAEIYDADAETSSKLVSISTLLSVITIPTVLYISNLIL